MDMLRPQTQEELAEALKSTASAASNITLGGAFTKDKMGGPILPSAVRISTAGMKRVLQYEPRDLTISVEAGITYRELTGILDANRQMVPLDPPFSDEATVGGILAANMSGPRRRLYGTARDMVIGLKFATVEGKLVQSGGMVVKNVAGLDMAKLLIGSFGTLAAIAVANFKLVPAPACSRTFIFNIMYLSEIADIKDNILRSALQPTAVDLVNPQASARLGREGYLLVVEAGGNAGVMDRYARELGDAEMIAGEEESRLWGSIRNFTSDFLAGHPETAVVKVACALSQVGEVMGALPVPAVARAGSGICYGYFDDCGAAQAWLAEASRRGWKAVIEFAPESRKQELDLWPNPGTDLDIMKRVKRMLDPANLLNRGRMYGRI